MLPLKYKYLSNQSSENLSHLLVLMMVALFPLVPDQTYQVRASVLYCVVMAIIRADNDVEWHRTCTDEIVAAFSMDDVSLTSVSGTELAAKIPFR